MQMIILRTKVWRQPVIRDSNMIPPVFPKGRGCNGQNQQKECNQTPALGGSTFHRTHCQKQKDNSHDIQHAFVLGPRCSLDLRLISNYNATFVTPIFKRINGSGGAGGGRQKAQCWLIQVGKMSNFYPSRARPDSAVTCLCCICKIGLSPSKPLIYF